MTALDSGSTMVRRMRKSLAPSMRAASMSSGGMPMKKDRITMKLNPAKTPGRISDQIELSRPSCLTMRNMGIRPGLKNSVRMMAMSINLPPSTGRLRA